MERQDTLEDLRVSSYDFTIAHVSKVGSKSYQGEADGEVVWGAGIMIILLFMLFTSCSPYLPVCTTVGAWRKFIVIEIVFITLIKVIPCSF